MQSRIVLSFLCAIGFFTLEAQTKLQPTADQFEELFSGWTDNNKPGITVAALNDGKIEFHKSWGLANLEHDVPISENSVFLFPGFSDQMIAFSVLLMEEEGLWSLNDHLGKYIPELPKSLKDKTISSLLNHTSSMQPLDDIKLISGYGSDDILNKEDFYNLVSMDLSATGKANGKHHFVKAGIRLLQDLIEARTGQSFSEYAEENLFGPLGMTKSTVVNDPSTIKGMAQGYTPDGKDFRIATENYDHLNPDQLYTCIQDLCLWVDNFWRAKVGSQKLWDKMDGFVMDEGKPVEERNQALYLGHHRYWDFRGEPKLYQIGVSKGYAAKVIRYPAHDLAIVVLGNFGRYNGHLCTAASELYLEEFFVDAPKKERPTFSKLSDQEKNKYCGHYWNYDSESMALVSLENDTLRYYEEQFNWKTNMFPVGGNKFFVEARSELHIEFSQDKEVTDYTLTNSKGDAFAFKKYDINQNWREGIADIEGTYRNDKLGAYYSIKENAEGLSLIHKRAGEILFHPMSQDQFKSKNGKFNRIVIDRGTDNSVVGFKLSNGNLKDIYFEKVEENDSSDKMN